MIPKQDGTEPEMNINLDSFTLTIIFLILLTIIGAFVSGRRKDRCLKDFIGYMITLEAKDDKRIWGRLAIATSGLELSYLEDHIDQDQNHIERSYILYKNEYGTIHVLFRFHDELSERNRAKRDRALRKAYHPSLFRRLRRKLRNVIVTIRDSLTQVSGMFLGRMKGANPVAGALASQQKQLTKIETEMFGMMGTAYDPILERYIGHKVVLEITTGDQIEEHVGILKEYSPEFLEMMDIEYPDLGGKRRRCDIIVPRAHAVIRHGAESGSQ
ncbi:MAG: hypothetical protein ACE5JP_05525 [Candidatus Bipolaricaulia bacterium]